MLRALHPLDQLDEDGGIARALSRPLGCHIIPGGAITVPMHPAARMTGGSEGRSWSSASWGSPARLQHSVGEGEQGVPARAPDMRSMWRASKACRPHRSARWRPAPILEDR